MPDQQANILNFLRQAAGQQSQPQARPAPSLSPSSVGVPSNPAPAPTLSPQRPTVGVPGLNTSLPTGLPQQVPQRPSVNPIATPAQGFKPALTLSELIGNVTPGQQQGVIDPTAFIETRQDQVNTTPVRS
jgi:hypothetical protein